MNQGWANDTAIVFYLLPLENWEGTYTITILVTDGLIATPVSDTVVIRFNAAPTVDAPTDISYIQGAPGNVIAWLPTDPVTGTTSYTVAQTGTVNNPTYQTGSWISGNPILVDVNGLGLGSYVFTITVNDGISATTATDMVAVTVTGNTRPALTASAGVTMIEGELGNTISWVVTDPNVGPTASYTISSNFDGVLATGSWIDGQNISLLLNGLSANAHTITITVNDGLTGPNIETSLISVTVNDNIAPSVNTPADMVTTFGEASTLDWTITDPSIGPAPTYVVTIDGTPELPQAWTSGTVVSVPLGGLALGAHTIEILVQDNLGESVFDSVDVFVNDRPVVTPPADASIADTDMVTLGINLIWTISDTFGTGSGAYTLVSTRIGTGTIIDQDVNVPHDFALPLTRFFGLSGLYVAGSYNFTLVVSDSYGALSVIVSTIITVFDSAAPTLVANSGDAASFAGGVSTFALSWTFTDPITPGSYRIDLSTGGGVTNASWVSGLPILYTWAGLTTAGIYTATITAYDGSLNGLSTVDMITITIEGAINVAPKIQAPSSLEYYESDLATAKVFIAIVDDGNITAPSAVVAIDGTTILTTTWASGSIIELALDDYKTALIVGQHEIGIVATDGAGGFDSLTISLLVRESLIPPAVEPKIPGPMQSDIVIAGLISVGLLALTIPSAVIARRKSRLAVREGRSSLSMGSSSTDDSIDWDEDWTEDTAAGDDDGWN
jgi:hypothetical protein